MAQGHLHLKKLFLCSFLMLINSCSIPTVRDYAAVENPKGITPTSEITPPLKTQLVSSSSLGPMIDRHPADWLPSYEKFYIQHSAKYIGPVAKRNEDLANETNDPAENLKQFKQRGRVISYGYVWMEESCGMAIYPAIYFQSIEITLYTTTDGAGEAYENVLTNILDSRGFVSQTGVSFGDQGTITQVNGVVCDRNARSFRLNFQRYNTRISINLRTLYGENEVPVKNLQSILLEMGDDIDQMILGEAQNHPGTSENLIALQEHAKTIQLPSTAADPSRNETPTQAGYVDDGTSQECVDLSVSDAVGPCYYYSEP